MPKTLTGWEGRIPCILKNNEDDEKEDEEEYEEEEEEEEEEEYEEGEYNPTRLQWALHMCGVHLTESEEEMCKDVHAMFSGSEN